MATHEDEAAKYEAIRGRLLRYVRSRVRDRETAEDLVQTALVRLARQRGRDDIEMHEAYAIVTVRNVLIDWYKKDAKRRRNEQALDPHIERTLKTADHAASIAGELDLLMAVKKLSARQRDALYLHLVDGWSLQEVAYHLGITRGSAKKHYQRAIKKLAAQELFDDERSSDEGSA